VQRSTSKHVTITSQNVPKQSNVQQSKVQNNVYVRNKHIPLNSTVEYV